jgi:hypothetical protein
MNRLKAGQSQFKSSFLGCLHFVRRARKRGNRIMAPAHFDLAFDWRPGTFLGEQLAIFLFQPAFRQWVRGRGLIPVLAQKA